jgi:hypothetical protein
VLQSIWVRIPPTVLRHPYDPYAYTTRCVTAGQLYSGAYGLVEELEEREVFLGRVRPRKKHTVWEMNGERLRRIEFEFDEDDNVLSAREVPNEDAESKRLQLELRSFLGSIERTHRSLGTAPLGFLERERLTREINTLLFADPLAVDGKLAKDTKRIWFGDFPLGTRLGLDDDGKRVNYFLSRLQGDQGPYVTLTGERLPAPVPSTFFGPGAAETSLRIYPVGDLVLPVRDQFGWMMDFQEREGKLRKPRQFFLGADWGEAASLDMAYKRARSGAWRYANPQWLVYHRPNFTGDRALFDDLTIYAPGLNTMAADIQAVLQAEAKVTPPVQGKIDPAAETLIDKARSAGWQTITIPGDPLLARRALTVHANGAGRYVYERVLWSGLKETVVCDGKTLLHLYPEIGVGAKRTVSVFHRAQLSGLVPWSLPPVEDLARGADVKAISGNTIALMPANMGRNMSHKTHSSHKSLHIHLVFADDGRLSERRLVLMPDNKTIYREVYRPGGTVVWFDGKDKQIAEVKLTVRASAAPDLKPDTAKLVLVPMPLRNPAESYTAKISNWNGDYSKLDEDTVVSVIAAHSWQYDWQSAQRAFKQRFEERGDRRLGFYTLLASGGYRPSKQVKGLDVNDPIFKYLETLPQASQQIFPRELGAIGPKNHFIQRLDAFRDLWLFFNSDRANPVAQVFNKEKLNAEEKVILERKQKLKAKRANAFAFLQDCPAPFAFALLSSMEDRAGSDREFQQRLSEQFSRLAGHPALGYASRYEQARCFLNGDSKGWAGKPFEKLYSDARKEGGLPLIDSTFVHSLAAGGYDSLVRETLADLIKEKRFGAVLTLARQNQQLGQHELASDVIGTMLAKIAGPEKPVFTVAAVDFLIQINRLAQADSALKTLLTDAKLAKAPALWRLAADLAQRRGITSRAALCLEKALDMEYRELPEVINLKKVRQDYTQLLTHYHQLALALTAIESAPPKNFVAKVVRAADRWRALDEGSTQACQLAAKVLQAIGARDLAWDYLTTPIAQRPNESGPWLAMAQTMMESDFDVADRAFTLAFKAEPTNAQILWDHAQFRHQFGRFNQAGQLYRQIAEGDWQPRFQNLRQQAQAKLNQ